MKVVVEKRNIAAVVLAAGASRRMGVDKLFLLLQGRPVLWHSLRLMASVPGCMQLVVVARPETFPKVQELVDAVGFEGRSCVVRGGLRRQDSVWAGLQAIHKDVEYVLIHDAARPFTRLETIMMTLEAAVRYGAAVCGCELSDTVQRVAADGRIIETPLREELRAVQTPQIFEKTRICSAYEMATKEGRIFTDDAAVAVRAGLDVYVVTSRFPNPKITYPGDEELYRHLLENR